MSSTLVNKCPTCKFWDDDFEEEDKVSKGCTCFDEIEDQVAAGGLAKDTKCDKYKMDTLKIEY